MDKLASMFETSLMYVRDKIHKCAVDHGFWESSNDGEKIALMHSELSEVLEANRKGNSPDDKVPELTAEEIELADCVIRILDYCGHKGYNLGKAIELKMDFNETRPYKHGKKY